MSAPASSSKKPAAKKAAAKKKARPEKTDPDAGMVVDNTTAADRAWMGDGDSAVSGMQAEVAGELFDVPDGAIGVPIAGRIVHILDQRDWRSSANSALQIGDFESWAEECLAPGEYEAVWCAIDDGRGPTLRQITDMFAVWKELTGNDAGKAHHSPNSLRRMARR